VETDEKEYFFSSSIEKGDEVHSIEAIPLLDSLLIRKTGEIQMGL
jgi:hypothetical protein